MTFEIKYLISVVYFWGCLRDPVCCIPVDPTVCRLSTVFWLPFRRTLVTSPPPCCTCASPSRKPIVQQLACSIRQCRMNLHPPGVHSKSSRKWRAPSSSLLYCGGSLSSPPPVEVLKMSISASLLFAFVVVCLESYSELGTCIRQVIHHPRIFQFPCAGAFRYSSRPCRHDDCSCCNMAPCRSVCPIESLERDCV